MDPTLLKLRRGEGGGGGSRTHKGLFRPLRFSKPLAYHSRHSSVHICIPFISFFRYTSCMTKKVYLVRHGESEDLVQKLHQKDDSVLSERGNRQAKDVACRFSKI